ncbi:AraC family transcriptional regulator [Shinella sp. CPCC 100929]|uniref:AraC family transcriptional regulator n=1 Tax=Shinella lacus TaxID=2654216 RepID=A0ABT1R0Y7_9HYPH|nr:AraC family transcriptional regulator [Shinella lacus]MCQ4628834.1 AraC family transcriptional regulator [Shinella lacus]
MAPHAAQILLTSAGRNWTGLDADFLHIPRGLSHVPGGKLHTLGMHFGPPVKADCSIGGRRMRRVQKPGDIDIVPAGMDGSWEDDADCRILRLSLHPSLLDQVAGELGRDAGKIELMPRFQVRDARLEGIGLAIKADLEADTPSDPLFIDLLANALAVRLIETASGDFRARDDRSEPKLSARQLRILTDFIEANLDQRLRLADLAMVAGVSVTRLKTLFRNSTGAPVHQYVIRRRVEYARALMVTTTMPASEIAVAAGFAHQSHMTLTMRRLLGQTPGEIARQTNEFRPNLQKSA